MSDILGEAIMDHHRGIHKYHLYVHDNFGPPVKMSTSVYFRNERQLPKLEKLALQLCKGTIADFGAGAGSHSLILQNKGHTITAYDISPLNCQVMLERGVKKVENVDIFTMNNATYDTILLLMNGIGLVNNIEGLHRFFKQAHTWTSPDGQLLFDSSDVQYMYEDYPMPTHYYGEIRCCYEYKNNFTEWFHWLYVDFNTIKSIANEYGWNCEQLYMDPHDQYLARCTKMH